MPFFVDKQRVAVYERDDLSPSDPMQNVVYIKSRMNWKETGIYKDALVSLRFGGTDALSEGRIGAAEMAAMRINVVAWDGPGFKDERGVPIPCTPEQIDEMDPTEPFWQKVLGEINTRNRARAPEDEAKKALTSTGAGDEPLTVEVDSAGHAVITTSSSSAQNGMGGRRTKLVN